MRREAGLVGWFALVLGLFALGAGASLLVWPEPPPEGLACKAVCGLQMLTAELLGPAAGALVAGLLWIAMGAVATGVGVVLLRDWRRG